ncbi:MAG: TetR/AcrR family transcriptional regulator [Bacteroides sp.]|nr:TetR/AcrR family transcriptional regulator [Eubacterium sp.]MCM1419638.1 TetR/AcrR family transcriptional regulator [Roseburia sp.]MCM1463608.1 TetR/AcrR family transcriptional regulator [Bacteroides sp.]
MKSVMSNLTKTAIKTSVLKLLNDRPISKITVKDVVEDCGINRNSFYYHFRDLPAAIEEIVTDEVNAIIAQYPTIDSIEECLGVAVKFALRNRRAALHLYQSANRDLFERSLFRVCESVVTTYMEKALTEHPLEERDKSLLIRFYKCECFGQVIDWMNGGMKEEAIDDFHRLYTLRRGMIDLLKLF